MWRRINETQGRRGPYMVGAYVTGSMGRHFIQWKSYLDYFGDSPRWSKTEGMPDPQYYWIETPGLFQNKAKPIGLAIAIVAAWCVLGAVVYTVWDWL